MNYRAARLKKIAHRLHRQGKFAESKEAQQLFKKAMQGGGRHGRGQNDEEAIREGVTENQETSQLAMDLFRMLRQDETGQILKRFSEFMKSIPDSLKHPRKITDRRMGPDYVSMEILGGAADEIIERPEHPYAPDYPTDEDYFDLDED